MKGRGMLDLFDRLSEMRRPRLLIRAARIAPPTIAANVICHGCWAIAARKIHHG
ncbi:hypothetical protein [Parasedimentitalea maritima]|uniref:Uncharacterized protein n=1 Tax=Parasedimentitalea maritima TaxID=2578117 RepID=A0A6A4RCV5_9RHOB|nr:hypothetical protein [Zongyanglinia marina]KAE9628517.1 hypothetical protein GP644_15160 [Zongyanglinia marina]